MKEDQKTNWLWPALLLGGLLLAGLLWWFNRPHEAVAPAVVDTASKVADTAVNTATAAWEKLGEKIPRSLPNGLTLNLPRLGVENRILKFYIMAPGTDPKQVVRFRSPAFRHRLGHPAAGFGGRVDERR